MKIKRVDEKKNQEVKKSWKTKERSERRKKSLNLNKLGAKKRKVGFPYIIHCIVNSFFIFNTNHFGISLI